MQELIQNILATVDKKGVQRDGKKILKKCSMKSARDTGYVIELAVWLYVYGHDREAAAVCGLDTPEVTLTVNYLADNSAERTLILAVGLSTGDGGRYVALDGDTTIYRMEESSLTQILTLSETGL